MHEVLSQYFVVEESSIEGLQSKFFEFLLADFELLIFTNSNVFLNTVEHITKSFEILGVFF